MVCSIKMGSSSNSQQLYSLTWSEFGSSLISAVQLLRGHTDLFDVTLAAGGRTFQAHKIVLSAASPFLLKILKSAPCKHPVILLAGVTASDLEALLEFVYRGEVSVDPSQLPSLLQAAHCLSIQGLAPTPPATSNDKPAEVAGVADTSTLANDGSETFSSLRKRKRAKRKGVGTGGGGRKWAKGEGNTVAGGDNANGDGKGEEGDINLGSDEAEGGSAAKARNASDQPGICPACGATLRQARNLRRHLLTTCKNRASAATDPDDPASSLPLYLEEKASSLPLYLGKDPLPPSSSSTHLNKETSKTTIAANKESHAVKESEKVTNVSTNTIKTPAAYKSTPTTPYHHNLVQGSPAFHYGVPYHERGAPTAYFGQDKPSLPSYLGQDNSMHGSGGGNSVSHYFHQPQSAAEHIVCRVSPPPSPLAMMCVNEQCFLP